MRNNWKANNVISIFMFSFRLLYSSSTAGSSSPDIIRTVGAEMQGCCVEMQGCRASEGFLLVELYLINRSLQNGNKLLNYKETATMFSISCFGEIRVYNTMEIKGGIFVIYIYQECCLLGSLRELHTCGINVF